MHQIVIGLLLINLAVIRSSPIDLKAKVMGAVEVESISRFPYQVAMFARFDTGSAFCSGSILSSKFIVTCAHCLVGSHNASIFYGSGDLANLDFDTNQVVDKANYRIHPSYSEFKNDIALIEMNSQIEFNDYIRPLRLTSSEDIARSFEDENLLMASWGFYSNEQSISNDLREANMQVISSNECAQVYAPTLITSSVICTKDSHCSGDSGSMMVALSANGEFLAVGIASFAYQNCQEGVTRPSVFMRISSFLDFIEANSDLTIIA